MKDDKKKLKEAKARVAKLEEEAKKGKEEKPAGRRFPPF